MVLSSTCISVAIIAQTVMMPRCETSDAAADGAGGGPVAALMGSEEVGERAPMLGVDVDDDAHAGAQRRIVGLAVDPHLHGNALHDLHPVAARILRRQQREFGAAGGADAFDRPRP